MKLLIGLSLLCFALSQQIVPVPYPADGFPLGNTNTTYGLTLDFYFDHLCTDTKAAYPGLMEYYNANKDWLQIIMHIFPLPYHTYAFYVATAGRYVQVNLPDKFLDFTSYIFDHQDTFLVDAYSWDIPTILNKLAQYTSTATGASFADALNGIKNATIVNDMMVSWKYSADREITGTPQYMVNQVLVPEASTYTKATSWKIFFDGLKPN